MADSSQDDADSKPEDSADQQNPIQRLINWRVSAAMEPHPPNQKVLALQQPLVDLLSR